MNKARIKGLLSIAVSLLIVAGIIVGIQFLTRDTIQKNEARKIDNAINTMFPGCTYSLNEEIQLSENEKKYINGIYEIWENESELAGYCFHTISSGDGDEVEMLTGVNLISSIAGIEILSHSESPIKWNERIDISLIPQLFKSAKTDSLTELTTVNGKTIVSEAVTLALDAVASASSRLLASGE